MIRHIPVCEITVDRLDPYFYRVSSELATVLSDGEQYAFFCDLCSEITDGSRNASGFSECGTPYLRVSNLTPSGIDLTGARFLSSTAVIEKKAFVTEGDILISKVAAVWKVAIVTQRFNGAVISPDVIKIRPKDNNARERLINFFNSPVGQLSFAPAVTQSVIPKISLKQLSQIKVPLNLLKEDMGAKDKNLADRQSLVAKLQTSYGIDIDSERAVLPEELWVNDELTNERLDVSYYQYLQSHLSHDLRERMRRECWVKLSEVASVVNTTVSPTEFSGQEIHYISMKNIDKAAFVVESTECVIFDEVASRARFKVQGQDVLLGLVGSLVGEEQQSLAIVPSANEGAIASSSFAVIRSKEHSSYYLLWCLNHPLVRFQLRMNRYGTTQLMLSVRSLLDIYVPLLTDKMVADIESIMKSYTGGV